MSAQGSSGNVRRPVTERKAPDFEPTDEEVSARFHQLVSLQQKEGTRVWRSARTLALTTPFFVLNAILPWLPSGARLTGVSLGQSLAVFGSHYALFVLAFCLAAHTPYNSRAYTSANRLESSLWIIGAAVLIGLSGRVSSVYWLHPAMVVVLSFPAIASHRAIRWLLLVATLVCSGLLAHSSSIANALFAAVVGGTLVVFQTLTMALAPRALRAQARAELLAERASEALLELERGRIRRELHDNLGAELTALLWSAQSMESGAREAEVRTLVRRVRAAIAELRTVMHTVAPAPMSIVTLSRELHRVLGSISTGRALVEVNHDAPSDRIIPGALCNALIVASKEAVRNAITHGGATVLRVHLRADREVHIEISDDGCGGEQALERGQGMRGMVERMRDVDGDVRWSNSSTGGIVVSLRAPLRGET